MAKKSAIARNEKRKKLVEKYRLIRAELKEILRNPNTTDADFFATQKKLDQLPRNSSKVRIRNRCELTGRPRAYHRKYRVSRLTLRELALAGKAPGVTKASW